MGIAVLILSTQAGRRIGMVVKGEIAASYNGIWSLAYGINLLKKETAD